MARIRTTVAIGRFGPAGANDGHGVGVDVEAGRIGGPDVEAIVAERGTELVDRGR